MPNDTSGKPVPAERLRENLSRVQAVRSAAQTHAHHVDYQMQLKRWQAERLSQTYADLLADDRYGPPAEFFRSDLYGPKDVSQRDRDMERIYPTMILLLPSSALDVVATALELDALSEELDYQLAVILWEELHWQDSLNESIYAEGYRRSGKHKERLRQIALAVEVGRDLDRLVQLPFLYTSLKLMRMPAMMAGLGDLQNFLERGFTAFRDMDGADEFLEIIRKRETAILEKLFAGHPRPFEAGN